MCRRIFRLFSIIGLFLTLVACNDFSISDHFNLAGQNQDSGGLSLTLQKNVLDRYESITLYPAGGIQPYSYTLKAIDLFYVGNTGSTASNINNTFIAGDSIGSVTISLLDAAGHSIDAIVTIRPPAVQDFTVNGATDRNQINISWSYSTPLIISGFRIERSIEGSIFQLIASPISSATIYTDSGLNQNRMYTYRIYVLAGEYLSQSSPEVSAQPKSY